MTIKGSRFINKDSVKLILIITGFYTVWTCIKFMHLLWMYKNNIPNFGEVVNPMDRLDNLILVYLLGIVLAYLLVVFVDGRSYRKRIRWLLMIPIHLMFSFLFGVVVMASALLLYYFKGIITLKNGFFDVLLYNVLLYIDMHFLTYFTFLGIILCYKYFKGLKDEMATKIKLKTALMEAKSKALNARLHPHFIFNVLNSVSALIEEDKEKAQKLLTKFGDMLRNIVNAEQSPVVSLESEIKNLKIYIDILKIRFQEDLKVQYDIEDGLGEVMVPNFFIQPIIENSINHGFDFATKELLIVVKIHSVNDWLEVKIFNNGRLLGKMDDYQLGLGKGLGLLRQRLQDHFDNSYIVSLRNTNNPMGVENVIKFPIENSLKKGNIRLQHAKYYH